MNTLIWILQVVLAGCFAMPAYLKLTTPVAKLVDGGQLSPGGNPAPVRLLGLFEVLGIIGIIVPQFSGILPILTPVTAVGFATVMAGAFVVHTQRKEYKVLPMIAIAFVLSVIVAYYRFQELL